jgi:hypothetical protein
MKRVAYCLLGLLLCAGCISKAKSDARVRAAFLAGRQQATAPANAPQVQGPSVQIVGNVKTKVVPWTKDLTLAKTLIAAEYQGVGDPSKIRIIRNGLITDIPPEQLLNGEDVPMQAGDLVEIHP